MSLYGKDSLLLERRLLSRTTEDSVTVTSVLVPWNTCGMTQSTVLGVATLTYLPYCFFNIISPIMSIVMSHFINRKMKSEKQLLECLYVTLFLCRHAAKGDIEIQ